jgi:soluble lytic murein transglycosylase-like protein
MVMHKINLVFILGLGLGNAWAMEFDRCFRLASTHYQIPTKLLKAIAKTETKLDPYAININVNKTYDIGIMQINSSWLTKLNRVGITQADLLDGCKNIQIGAWILASNIKQYGFNTKAIGAYNSPTPTNQERYARKVLSNME